MNYKFILAIILLFSVSFLYSDDLKKDQTNDIEKNLLSNENKEVISKIEFSHFMPLRYLIGSNMPGFFYGFEFSYILPFITKANILSQSNFKVNISNATNIFMDKVGLSLELTPINFLDLHAGFNTYFSWTLLNGSLEKGESLYSKEGKATNGIGYNLELGTILKLGFQQFFPKVKLVLMDKSIFNYWFYPDLKYWKNKLLDIMLEDSWIFSNDFILMWNEKYFMPFTSLNITYYFIRPDEFSLMLSGGCNFKIPKADLIISASTGIYFLSPTLRNSVVIKILIKHTFGKINIYKRNSQ